MVNEQGKVVSGHVSNGDFHWESPKPAPATDSINGTVNTPFGWTKPDFMGWSNDDPFCMFWDTY